MTFKKVLLIDDQWSYIFGEIVVLFQNQKILYFRRSFGKMIIYFQPYDPMFSISKDRLQCNFFDSNLIFMFPIYTFCYQSHNDVSNLLFCHQSHNDVSNLILCFQFKLFLMFISSNNRFQSAFSNVWFQSKYNLALDSLFPIYEFYFQTKFIVSNVLFLFPIS